MNNIIYHIEKTDFGLIYLSVYKYKINRIYVTDSENMINIDNEVEKLGNLGDNSIIKSAVKQIREYLNGNRKEFDIPLSINGTKFQKKVWEQTSKIPYGEVLTYGQIAKNIGISKGARAVGGALNKNPIGIVIPCHRVIGKNNKLTGFAGGIKVKKRLLMLEGYNI